MADTGGIGLLQQLVQSGFPPELLVRLLTARSQPAADRQDNELGGGGPGGPVGSVGATTSGEGMPGVGPSDPTVATGLGNMNLSQALSAGYGGMRGGGLLGQALNEGLGLAPGNLAGSLGAKAATGLLGFVGGFPGAPFGIANSLLGMLAGIARGAQDSTGFRGPQTLPEAAKEFAQNLRGLLGLPPAPELPFPQTPNRTDLTPEDPNVPNNPDAAFPDAPPGPTYPDLDVTFPDVGLAGVAAVPEGADSGIGPGIGGNPGGGEGED